MTRTKLSIGFSALLLLWTAACTQKETVKEVAQALPPQKIEKSIQPSRESSEGLKIQKSSLGKLFLLRATVKTLKSAASWEDLKPMLVIFEKSGDRLGMFEMDTYATYKVVDTKRLVTTFKITDESESDLTFEWGEGLKLVNRSFYDDPEDQDDTAAKENKAGLSSSIESVSSFTKSAQIRDNQLHVRQALRVRASFLKNKALNPRQPEEKTESLETREMAVEVDYVLKPYAINPRFQPKEIDPLRRIGFFQTSVGKENRSESKTVYAAHWDFSPEAGPVIFALSKNFPPEVLSAVKEGVLYWNFVLGADKIRVVENFDPETDFPDRTVVVNWLPWEDAGASWANFQTDPLTGEILRGQIYLTSVFLQISKIYPESENPEVLSLDGMPSGRTCQFPVQSWQLPSGLSDNLKKEYILDQLRHVVAHEAGHTMGLRHNFAGSMDSELKISEINIEKKKYETDPNYQGAALSSTIMDYIRGLEEGMIGRLLKYKALGYDADALKWVNSRQEEANTKYAYCTDDDIAKAYYAKESLYGCERFDTPANPFSVRGEEIKRILSRLVETKFNAIVEALYPENSNRVLELEAVLNQDYKDSSASLITGRGTAVSSILTTPMSYLYQVTGGPNENTVVYFKNRVQSRWDSSPVDLSEILKAHLIEAGGIAPLVQAILPFNEKGDYDSYYLANQLKALKASGRFAKGVTASGRKYEFTEAQQAQIEKYLQKGIDAFDTTLIAILAQYTPYRDKDVTDKGKTVKESKTILSGIGQDQWFPAFSKILKSLILADKEMKTEKLNGKDISYGTHAFISYYRNSLVQMMPPTLWQASSVPKTDITDTRAALVARLTALYQQLDLGTDPALAAPATDAVADHEAFLLKLLGASKIPSSIYSLATEDISVIKELDKIK